jgi:hypothetical protein
MQNIPESNQRRKPIEDFFPDIPPVPPDPLIEIADLVRKGFNYARHCLSRQTGMGRQLVKLTAHLADLERRQAYLENLIIEGGK